MPARRRRQPSARRKRLARIGRSVRPRYARRFRRYLNPLHYFRRSTIPDIVALTSNVAGYGGTGFIGTGRASALNQLINSGDFTALYDQYKIIKTTFRFKWSISSTTPADNLLNNPPVMMYFRDHDDIATPDHQMMMERATTKYITLRPNRVYSITVRPSTLGMVYNSPTSTAYQPNWGKFIDMLDNAVPHFGLKVAWNYPPSTAYGSVQVWQTMTIACKGQR